MSALSSISTAQRQPSRSAILSTERLRAGLEACGYDCTSVVNPGARFVPPGCAVSVQFGDRIESDADGSRCLTLHCSVQVNGSKAQPYGTTCWKIRKLFSGQPDRSIRACFAVEVDLILGGDVRLSDVLAYGGNAYRHLHMLIGDAGATLRDVSRSRNRNAITPVVRIEARFFGDLAAGRSGLINRRPTAGGVHSIQTVAQNLLITRAACDLLKDDILPDLATAVRRIVQPAQTTIPYSAATDSSVEGASSLQSPMASWPHSSTSHNEELRTVILAGPNSTIHP